MPGDAGQLAHGLHHRMQRARPLVRRALKHQHLLRRQRETVAERLDRPGLADPRRPGKIASWPCRIARVEQALQQPDLMLATDDRREGIAVQRLEQGIGRGCGSDREAADRAPRRTPPVRAPRTRTGSRARARVRAQTTTACPPPRVRVRPPGWACRPTADPHRRRSRRRARAEAVRGIGRHRARDEQVVGDLERASRRPAPGRSRRRPGCRSTRRSPRSLRSAAARGDAPPQPRPRHGTSRRAPPRPPGRPARRSPHVEQGMQHGDLTLAGDRSRDGALRAGVDSGGSPSRARRSSIFVEPASLR